MDRYALFAFNEDEPCGGVNDFEMFGTMAECMAWAETRDHETVVQIVELERMTVVKYGGWLYTPMDLETGLTADRGKIIWHYRWADA